MQEALAPGNVVHGVWIDVLECLQIWPWRELDSAEEAQMLCGFMDTTAATGRVFFPGTQHPWSSTPALWLDVIVVLIWGSKKEFLMVEVSSWKLNGPDYLHKSRPVWIIFTTAVYQPHFLPCIWLWFLYLSSLITVFAFMEMNYICQFRLEVVLVFFLNFQLL